MTRGWISQFFCMIGILFLLTGCSSNPEKGTKQDQNLFTAKIGSVNQASVITTDGQEIDLNMADIKKILPTTTEEIYRSTDRLKEADVRYTLLAYRENQAPLVIEVGETACQFEEVTYRGKDTQTFYQKIAELTGQALLEGTPPQSIDCSALDKGDRVSLTQQQTQQLWQIIEQAKYQERPDYIPYPLFPQYQLKLDFGDRVRELRMLTPSLITIQVGDDVLYYRVSSSMFSLFTKYITPQPTAPNPIDQLFKADGIDIYPLETKEKLNSTLPDPILWESLAHQFVRILKQGNLDHQKTTPANEQIKYKVTLRLGDNRKEVDVYANGFMLDGQRFLQPKIVSKLGELVTQYKILEMIY